ncbi:unnamed protein product [Pedinophyceae sp. YPF-701]|nr:unnamed protein product [Pedinophyceae sp. YPF-701]
MATANVDAESAGDEWDQELTAEELEALDSHFSGTSALDLGSDLGDDISGLDSPLPSGAKTEQTLEPRLSATLQLDSDGAVELKVEQESSEQPSGSLQEAPASDARADTHAERSQEEAYISATEAPAPETAPERASRASKSARESTERPATEPDQLDVSFRTLQDVPALVSQALAQKDAAGAPPTASQPPVPQHAEGAAAGEPDLDGPAPEPHYDTRSAAEIFGDDGGDDWLGVGVAATGVDAEQEVTTPSPGWDGWQQDGQAGEQQGWWGAQGAAEGQQGAADGSAWFDSVADAGASGGGQSAWYDQSGAQVDGTDAGAAWYNSATEQAAQGGQEQAAWYGGSEQGAGGAAAEQSGWYASETEAAGQGAEASPDAWYGSGTEADQAAWYNASGGGVGADAGAAGWFGGAEAGAEPSQGGWYDPSGQGGASNVSGGQEGVPGWGAGGGDGAADAGAAKADDAAFFDSMAAGDGQAAYAEQHDGAGWSTNGDLAQVQDAGGRGVAGGDASGWYNAGDASYNGVGEGSGQQGDAQSAWYGEQAAPDAGAASGAGDASAWYGAGTAGPDQGADAQAYEAYSSGGQAGDAHASWGGECPQGAHAEQPSGGVLDSRSASQGSGWFANQAQHGAPAPPGSGPTSNHSWYAQNPTHPPPGPALHQASGPPSNSSGWHAQQQPQQQQPQMMVPQSGVHSFAQAGMTPSWYGAPGGETWDGSQQQGYGGAQPAAQLDEHALRACPRSFDEAAATPNGRPPMPLAAFGFGGMLACISPNSSQQSSLETSYSAGLRPGPLAVTTLPRVLAAGGSGAGEAGHATPEAAAAGTLTLHALTGHTVTLAEALDPSGLPPGASALPPGPISDAPRATVAQFAGAMAVTCLDGSCAESHALGAAEDRWRLWRLLEALCKTSTSGRGSAWGKREPATSREVALALCGTPTTAAQTDPAGSRPQLALNCPAPLTCASDDEPTAEAKAAAAARVQELAIEGLADEALAEALRGGLWEIALVLAARTSPERFEDAAAAVAARLAPGAPLRALLAMLANRPEVMRDGGAGRKLQAKFARASAATAGPSQHVPKAPGSTGSAGSKVLSRIASFARPSAGETPAMPHPADDPAVAAAAGDTPPLPELCASWRENLAVLASNGTLPGAAEQMSRLGDRVLAERGDLLAAHTCLLLAGCPPEPQSPGARVMLLGADHRVAGGPDALPAMHWWTVQAIRRTEVFERCLASPGPQTALPALLPFKVVRAMQLVEIGALQPAFAYLAAVEAAFRAMGQGPPAPHLRVSWSLGLESVERLRVHMEAFGVPTAQQGAASRALTGIGRWLDRGISRLMRSGGGVPDAVAVASPAGKPPMPSRPSGSERFGPATSGGAAGHDASQDEFGISGGGMHRRTQSDLQGTAPPDKAGGASNGDSSRAEPPARNTASGDAAAAARKKSSPLGLGNIVGAVGRGLSGMLARGGDKQVKLGEESKFFYDEKLGIWRVEGEEGPPGAGPPAPGSAGKPPTRGGVRRNKYVEVGGFNKGGGGSAGAGSFLSGLAPPTAAFGAAAGGAAAARPGGFMVPGGAGGGGQAGMMMMPGAGGQQGGDGGGGGASVAGGGAGGDGGGAS